MNLHDLSTPCLVVERRVMERNLDRMQERADHQRVALRPHTKTHKSLTLARRQLDGGGRGITVAKVGEAEVFVGDGFDDVRIAYPLFGVDKYRRLARLRDRARISFCVDTWEAATAASAFFAGQPVEVLLKIDAGYHRAGVPWDEPATVDLAERIASLPGMALAGILTHAGQAYEGASPGETPRDALARYAALERDRMLAVAAAIETRLGNTAFEISIGSTPTMSVFENRDLEEDLEGHRITEIRPGNYVFLDRTQVALGSAELGDCALTALFTVTSRHREPGGFRLILDGGRKILTSDPCGGGPSHTGEYGLVLDGLHQAAPMSGARLYSLSEEHARVRIEGEAGPAIGSRVRVVPNHACVAVNTQDCLYLVDGEEVIQALPVSARGHGK